MDGITGASVGAGRTLEVTLDLQDASLDAGGALHADASVGDMRDSPRVVSIPLTTQGASARGRTCIDRVSYK